MAVPKFVIAIVEDLSVIAKKLAPNSVITEKLADLSVTAAKLADGIVTGAKADLTTEWDFTAPNLKVDGVEVLASGAPVAPSKVRYVDVGAVSGGDGSLTSPFDTIAGAIAVAIAGDEIAVFPGTYTVVGSVAPPTDVSMVGQGGAERTILTGPSFTGVVVASGSLVQGITSLVDGGGLVAFTMIGATSAISRCTADAANNPDNPFKLTDAATGGNRIENCHVSGAWTADCVLAQQNGTAYVSHLTFDATTSFGVALTTASVSASVPILHASGIAFGPVVGAISNGIQVGNDTTLIGRNLTIDLNTGGGFDVGIQVNDTGSGATFRGNGIELLNIGAATGINMIGSGSVIDIRGITYDETKVGLSSGATSAGVHLDSFTDTTRVILNTATSVAIAYGAAFDGKPVSAMFAEADGAITVANATWNGSGTLTVRSTAAVTGDRDLFIIVHVDA